MRTINAIYLIDDDPITLFSVKKLIEITKISDTVHCFHNGHEALEFFNNLENKNQPALILLDLNMPVVDGWEFMDAYSKLNLSTKIVIYVMTSSINPSDAKKVKAYNKKFPFLVKHLIKPINKDKLIALAQEYATNEL
ncbi:response regulator [Galbibacter sp.]|uniref:response regulator n=1 Tax=Galbibacter sp. TaxID=2918471 RepID=UPI002B5C6232|nr:response regulator [Galbibacter sp.]HLV62045.1 response regulator [Galbibacter sp.]